MTILTKLKSPFVQSSVVNDKGEVNLSHHFLVGVSTPGRRRVHSDQVVCRESWCWFLPAREYSYHQKTRTACHSDSHHWCRSDWSRWRLSPLHRRFFFSWYTTTGLHPPKPVWIPLSPAVTTGDTLPMQNSWVLRSTLDFRVSSPPRGP